MTISVILMIWVSAALIVLICIGKYISQNQPKSHHPAAQMMRARWESSFHFYLSLWQGVSVIAAVITCSALVGLAPSWLVVTEPYWVLLFAAVNVVIAHDARNS